MTADAMACAVGGMLSLLPTSNGISREARALSAEVSNARSHLFGSISLMRVADEALADLQAAYRSAILPNWDGYGAQPLNPFAYAEAARFLTALPPTTPVPSVGVDPDGEVEIGWDFGPRCVFSVSVGPAGRLTYAGLFGMSRSYGTEWLGEEIPRPVLDNLARAFAARQ